MSVKLKRELSRWAAITPQAISDGSAAQFMYAIADAQHDIAALSAEITRLRAENARLRSILDAILAADERGQGVRYDEAMDRARAALEPSDATPDIPRDAAEALVLLWHWWVSCDQDLPEWAAQHPAFPENSHHYGPSLMALERTAQPAIVALEAWVRETEP